MSIARYHFPNFLSPFHPFSLWFNLFWVLFHLSYPYTKPCFFSYYSPLVYYPLLSAFPPLFPWLLPLTVYLPFHPPFTLHCSVCLSSLLLFHMLHCWLSQLCRPWWSRDVPVRPQFDLQFHSGEKIAPHAPAACLLLFITSSLVIWSLHKMLKWLQNQLIPVAYTFLLLPRGSNFHAHAGRRS